MISWHRLILPPDDLPGRRESIIHVDETLITQALRSESLVARCLHLNVTVSESLLLSAPS